MLSINIHKTLHGSEGQMRLDVKLDILQGQFVVLMGKSGSGKTTLLRVLAGLEKAEGSVVFEDKLWNQLPVQERQIGFVFQDYALFENMSVEENLLYVNADKTLAKELLELTELVGLSSRNVKSLSGGQKQRVALCRAMMNRPKLLLMDEPLSALDSKMKNRLQEEIAKLHKTFGTTTLMVSHDAESSYALSDRIIVLEQGKIIKDGSKDIVLKKEQKTVYSL
jgi:molybdate transport system ATP-binding protein